MPTESPIGNGIPCVSRQRLPQRAQFQGPDKEQNMPRFDFDIGTLRGGGGLTGPLALVQEVSSLKKETHGREIAVKYGCIPRKTPISPVCGNHQKATTFGLPAADEHSLCMTEGSQPERKNL